MTEHDKVRKILHDAGFTFGDGRTALNLSDAEVEKFITVFVDRMSELGVAMTLAFQMLTISINNVVKPMQNLGKLLAEAEEEQTNG